MLKIESEVQEHRLLTLKVEVDDERLLRARRAAARRLSARMNIPGFRKGKTPYEIVRRQVGDGAIMEEALEPLMQEVYREALKQENVDAAAPGALKDVTTDPMVFTFTVPLRPLVDLGDYRSLRVPFTPGTIDEQELEQQMEHLREHQAIIDPVERPAQLDDVVVVNVSGRVLEPDDPDSDGFLLDDKGVSVLLGEALDWPGPGFAQYLTGIEAGETREVDYTFPADYGNEALREVAAHFTVEALEVKSREVPEWSDDLAQSIGDFETMADVRETVRSEMQERADKEMEDAYRQGLVDQLVAGAEVDYPLVLLEQEVSLLLEQMDKRLRRERLTLADYYRIEKTSEEEVRKGLKPRAEQRLVRSLALGELAHLEQLSVPESDLDAAVASLSYVYRNQSPNMRELLLHSPELRRSVAVDALAGLALQRLSAIAKGENPPIGSPAADAAGKGADAAGEAVPAGDLRPVRDGEAVPAAESGGQGGEAAPAAGEAGEAAAAPAAAPESVIQTDQTGPLST